MQVQKTNFADVAKKAQKASKAAQKELKGDNKTENKNAVAPQPPQGFGAMNVQKTQQAQGPKATMNSLS